MHDAWLLQDEEAEVTKQAEAFTSVCLSFDSSLSIQCTCGLLIRHSRIIIVIRAQLQGLKLGEWPQEVQQKVDQKDL